MDAAPAPDAPPLPPAASDPIDADKRTDLVLDAVKRAIADPGEHRLFRAGKLAGLFPSRAGASADAALLALTDGLLETVRTEAKGRQIVEWVRATPKGMRFVHDRDSPKAVLRELREVIGATRDGVPEWMDAARREVATLADRFDRQATELVRRLDALTERVEAALRRAEAGAARVPGSVADAVPWAVDALEYLDRRPGAGAPGPCPLGDLFHAVRERHPPLGVPEFHAGLRRLHDVRAVRLAAGPAGADPEYTILVGTEACSVAHR